MLKFTSINQENPKKTSSKERIKSFKEIYSTVLSKLFIFPGIAEINIAEINNLEKKSKKDLILLFLKIVFFILLS